MSAEDGVAVREAGSGQLEVFDRVEFPMKESLKSQPLLAIHTREMARLTLST